MDKTPKNKVLFIAGVTASGKSDLASKIAEVNNGVIINADSRQVYKLVCTITDQPPDCLLKDCYRLYSYCHLNEEYSVARWLEDAHLEVRDALKKGKLPILLGGTGFYLSAFIKGLSLLPKPSEAVKTRVDSMFHSMSRDEFYSYYLSKDPSLNGININDTYRLLRAATFLEETGMALRDFHLMHPPKPLFENVEVWLIIPEVETTKKKIQARLDNMLDYGAMNEVIQLKEQNLINCPASKTIYGILELHSYLEGHISLDTARAIIAQKTIQYAKRQRTWFRNQYKNSKIFNNIAEAQEMAINF